MEKKWIDRKYYVQDNADVVHQDIKIYCTTNQFPALPFCGPHSKPHGARELIKHYHLSFDPKLGNVVCEILLIPCACVACTRMLEKTWILGITSDKQERYKPVTNCTDWSVLGSFNNWNIIQLSQKSTPYDKIDEMHQVAIDGISDNMDSLVESVQYGAINKTDIVTNRFYVIMFIPEAYILQDNTTTDRQIITAGKLVVKAQYLCSVQVDTNWYWNQHTQQHVLTVPTRTIIHPRLEVNPVKYFHAIPKIVCNRTQVKTPYQYILYV